MPRKPKKNNNATNKAYKFRIYPNNEQIILISKTFGCVRKLYNTLLDDKTNYYERYRLSKNKLKEDNYIGPRELFTEEDEEIVALGPMFNKTVGAYKEDFLYFKEVDSLALANSKLNLESAFNNFFSKKSSYPKFHKKGTNDTYTTNNVNNSIRIESGRIRLPKLGFVKVKQHRQIGRDETIKSCTVSKKAGKYFVSIVTEKDKENIVSKTEISDDKILGIDFSVPHFAVASNGITYDYPKYFRNAEKRLAIEQRKLSRKQFVEYTDDSGKTKTKSSKNRQKQQLKVQKLHDHIANQRKDFCHKLSRELVNNYDVIVFEDINLSAMKRQLRFGKSISDEGFGMFRSFCQYKLENEYKYFIKIGKTFASSQLCHVCGYKNPITKDLNIRNWVCPSCNTEHDRDHNASLNIREEGKRILTDIGVSITNL